MDQSEMCISLRYDYDFHNTCNFGIARLAWPFKTAHSCN